MRIYSTSAAVISTVRVEGYCPSLRTAVFLASHVSRVLELTPEQEAYVVKKLRAEVISIEENDGSFSCIDYSTFGGFTPAEERAIEGLLAWWGATVEDEPLIHAQKAYFLVNLNTGTTLCVIARASREDPHAPRSV